MNIKSGTLLRQYKILKAIGAGGMGEVYRAQDTNLDREVAVKVLPPSVADDENSLARLDREAKAVAALSHPNILAVYDFGTEEGTAYLVTELLEGETLRERLDKGAVPPRKATDIGRQIARGLAAAHDKGIVHRDLKPENIFLTSDGQVKILDFGLATASPSGTEVGSENLATMTNITLPGTVLGTVNYMSPEHVRSHATDNRSDLFSFGSVLYEMVGGARPFQRETAAETMTAILKEDPVELATLVVDIPASLTAIIRRCLEKEPGERFHSAHDLAFSLEALSGSAVSTGSLNALTDLSGPKRRMTMGAVISLVLLGLVAGAAGAWLLRPSESNREILEFTNLSSRRGLVTNARFTGADGNAFYSATWDGLPVNMFPVSPTATNAGALDFGDAHLFSISSTGEIALSLDRRPTIGFEAIGTLAIAESGGAAPRPVLENVMSADWAPNGRDLAVAREVDGVVRLEYPIGTVLYEAPGWIGDLRVSPDGERVAFADRPLRGDNYSDVKIIDRAGAIDDLEINGPWGLAWSPNGQYVYASGGGGIRRQAPGQPREQVANFPSLFHILDIDASGKLLAASGIIRRESFVKAKGTPEFNLSWRDWTTPRHLSDDGKLLFFEEGNEFNQDGYAIYLRKTDGSAPQRLAFGSIMAVAPDGEQVAVYQGAGQAHGGLRLLPTGVGEAVDLPLGDLELNLDNGLWLRQDGPEKVDGLLLAGFVADESQRLYFIPTDGTPWHAITPLDMQLAHHGHVVSRDGRRIVVSPAGQTPVEFDFDGNGPTTLPGLDESDVPMRFDRDGFHLYTQKKNAIPAEIYKVDLRTGERILWKKLTPGDPAGVAFIDHVKVSADGLTTVYSIRRRLSSLVLVEGLNLDR